jgi:dTDP-4-amino-4,6-dideoxygalactose transaminase
MNKPTFAPWPSFDQEIVDAVSDILRSGKVSQWTGPNVYAFEREYARYLGVDHAIAMANGSVSLDVALKVLGIGPGDEVVVTSRSFVASASCVALAGALPVFADVDAQSGNVTAETIAPVLTKKTRAVIVVHLAGWPCDMDPILKLCRLRKIAVIEDCAQANGAKYKGRHVGTMGDFGSFSFCQDKIFTTGGEGGLLVTNNTKLWKQAWSLKDHGRDLDIVRNRPKGTGFVWMVNSFGTNHRMNEIQAAIGRIFLKRLDKMVSRRRKYAAMLDKEFGEMDPLVVIRPSKGIEPAYYKYYVQVDPKKLKKGLTRDGVLQKLAALGVPCGCGACPEIYREKAFQRQRKELGFAPQKRLPAARRLGENCIMLQVHPTLSKECIEYTIEAMKKALE